MQRRERAGRIGVAGVAGEGERLAAAAAPILLAELAALARLGHPAGAAILLKASEFSQIQAIDLLPHAVELEAGDALGGVAGQDLAGGRDVEELAAPAAHALLRPLGVIVRDHVVDDHLALEPVARFLDQPRGGIELLDGGHQRGAVLERPAIILDVGDLEPVGVDLDRHLDDVGQLVEVLAVHDGVDRQRQPAAFTQRAASSFFLWASLKPAMRSATPSSGPGS